MNDWTCDLVIKLLKNKTTYLRVRPNSNGRKGFGLYQENQVLIHWYSEKQVDQLKDVLKVDKQKRLTLNLSLVRQLHGKSYIKQQYKKLCSIKEIK